jgi:hypothetical protein
MHDSEKEGGATMSLSVDTDLLFVAAVSVWNRALDAHRGSSPYEQILAGLQSLPSRRATIELYDQDPTCPVAGYVVRFQNGLIEPAAVELGSGPVFWRARVDYLETVVNQAEVFIQDPARLDWQWLKDWAGVGD